MDAFKNDNVKNLQTIDFIGCYVDKNQCTGGTIYFSGGYELFLGLDTYWDLTKIEQQDFKGLFFDLESDDFLGKIERYAVVLKPVKGDQIIIPCYALEGGVYSIDGGVYSTNVKLFLNRIVGVFDVNEIKSTMENEND